MSDFKLTGDLDLSPAKKEVQEYIAFLRSETTKANTATQGTGAKVPTGNSGVQADKQRLEVQKKLIDAQARFVALKQQEATISAKASGKTVSKSELGAIKTAGLKEIESVIPGMTSAQKGRFTKAVNSQIASIEGQLKGLSGNDLQKAFAEIAGVAASKSTTAKTETAQQKTAMGKETKAVQKAAAIQEERTKTLGKQYAEIQKELNSAVAAAGKAKTIAEKAAAGAEVKRVLEKEARLNDQLDKRNPYGTKYNPLKIDDRSSIELAERRKEEQKRTGKYGTAAGGYGASELQIGGSFPLAAFTESLKSTGKSAVKFLDEASGAVTDFAKFLGDTDMSDLMNEFGVTRGPGKNQATYKIADQSRAEEFQTRANSLLEQKKAQRLAEIADERTYTEAAADIGKDRRRIEDGRGSSDQIAAAEAVFVKELLDAKADLEKLGLSTDEVRAALSLLTVSVKAEAADVNSLVQKGIAKPGNEWVGPSLNNFKQPSVELDPAAEARVLDQLTRGEVQAQAEVVKAKQDQAQKVKSEIDRLSDPKNLAGISEQEAAQISAMVRRVLTALPKVTERINAIGTDSKVPGMSEKDLRARDKEIDGKMRRVMGTAGRIGDKDEIAISNRITNDMVKYASESGWLSGTQNASMIPAHELGHIVERMSKEAFMQAAEIPPARKAPAYDPAAAADPFGAPTRSLSEAEIKEDQSRREKIKQAERDYIKRYDQVLDSFLPADQKGQLGPRVDLIKKQLGGYAAQDYKNTGKFTETIAEAYSAVFTDNATELSKALVNESLDIAGLDSSADEILSGTKEKQAAVAAGQLAEEQEAATKQKVEDAKQEAADKQISSAKTEQAAAAKKLSAAQARAVNLVADGTAVTKEQLKGAGVKSSTIRSLEDKGAITSKPDGTLQASDAAIAAAKQTQLAAVQKQTTAETQTAAAATRNAAKEAELAALKDTLKTQVQKGIITASEANTKFLNAGGRGDFNSVDSAVPVSQLDEKAPRKPRRNREQIIHDEEGGLIEALRRKIKALNAQARVLENKLGPFTQAEALLIDALNRKAKALLKQIEAIEAGQVIVAPAQTKQTKTTPTATPTTESPNTVPVAEAASPKTKKTGKEKALGLDDFFDDNSDVKSAEEAADAARIATANTELTAAEAKSLAAQKELAEAFDADYAAVIAAEEAADAARLRAASAEQKSAGKRIAAANVTETLPPTSPAAVAATNSYLNSTQFATGEKVPPFRQVNRTYTDKKIPDGFDELDVDQTEAAEAALARAFAQYAQIVGLVSSQFLEDFIDIKAATKALRTRLNGMINLASVDDNTYLDDQVRGRAETVTANTVVGAGVKGELLDSNLTQQYVQAKLENIGYTKAESAMIAKMLADDPAQLKADAESLIATNKLTAATLKKVRDIDGGIASEAEVLTQRTVNRSLTKREALKDSDYRDALRLDQINRLQERRARSGNPGGIWGKLTQAVGYDRSGGSSLTEFFGGGALSSLRYGLPSMLLYGAGSGIANTIKEAEELQYNLARLEGQFNSTFAGQDFGPVRQQILGVAKDTGLAADEIANLQIQLTGAFGKDISIGGLEGEDLVKSQVESAAKLAQTVGLPLNEITDGLTAASLAFGKSFEEIGDVALAIEQESGVLAKETISFIGDIAPVAKEAGYSLEEFSAIAAVAQQRSGRSGTALAESFGRVIPAITEQKDKLLELAAIDPSLATNDFVDAIRSSDPKAILDSIGKSYNDLNKEAQQTIVTLLGGRREAQALIPALANQDLTDRYKNVAQNSEGTLEERFLKVRDTLTNAVQRITEAVRQLGVELLEAGLADVFDTAASAAGLLLKAITPIAKVVGTINDVLGNMPVNILLGLAAWKLLTRAMTKPGLDPATRLPDPNAARVNRFNFGALGGTPRFLDDYRARRGGGYGLPALPPGVSPPLGYGQMPIGPATYQNRRQAFFGAAGTSGKNLLTGLGGGSAVLGGVFVGITALGAIKGFIDGQIDKAKKDLDDLRAEIDSDNEKLDFDDSSILNNRIAELRSRAEDEIARVEEWYEGWNGLLVSLNVVQSRVEVLATEAAVLENFDPKIQEFFDSLDNSMEKLVSDLIRPKLGRGTRKFREAVAAQGRGASEDRFEVRDDGKIDKTTGGVYRQDEADFIKESARLANVDVEQLDSRIVELLLDPGGNPVELIQDAAEAKGKYADYGEEFVDQAAAVRDAFAEAGQNDKGITNAIAAMKKAEEDIDKLEGNQLQLDELDAAFSTGVISLDEYVQALSKRLEERRNILQKGDQTDSTELELIRVLQAEQEANRKISDAILKDQERLVRIAEAYGAAPKDLQAASYETNLANLRNPAFKDKDARLNAALQLIEDKKNADLRIAQDNNDMAEVARLLNEGSTVPPEARQAIFESNLYATDAWKALAEDLKAVEAISAFSISIPKSGETVSTIFNSLGSTPEEIANKLLGEFFSLGTLSAETQGKVGREIDKLQAQLGEGNLTPEERAAIIGSVDGLIDFLKFVGLPEQLLLDFLAGGDFDNPDRRNGETKAGAQDRIRKEYEQYTSSSAFDGTQTPEEKAKYDKKKEADVVRAAFGVREARANRDSLLLARIEKEKAAFEKSQAQEIEDPLERQAALFEAEAAAIKAKQSEVDALKALSDARFEFMKAVAQVNGDLIQVAQLEVQRLESDLALARSTGDPNAAAIAGQLLIAQDQLRKDLVESRGLDFDLFATYLESEGDAVNAALTRVKQAEFVLANARGRDEERQAQIELINAQKAYKEAQQEERNAVLALKVKQESGEDPVAQARLALQIAKENLANAKSVTDKANAQIAVIDAQKQLEDAMAGARISMFSLRQAELQAMDDQIGAAQIAVEIAKQQLNDAIKQKQGTASINNAKAALITAEKQLTDTIINEKLDEYKWLLDMGQITQGQYVKYLESLQSTLAPGSKQFKDLALTIKQLKDGIQGDLQANLPTSLTLPTLYEVRRFDQTPQSGTGGLNGGIGYQDNRNVSVTVEINEANSAQETAGIVLKTLETAMGTGRNGYGARRI